MDRPPAPPEAVLIRLTREAAGMRIAEAAEKAGVSVARWSQIEAGSEMRHGTAGPVTGRAGTIARMARAIPGVTPERLETEGRRPDAAEILREMARDDAPVLPPAVSAAPPRQREQETDADPELAPFLQGVLDDLAGAMRRFGPGFTGAQAFGDTTERQRAEAAAWDDAEGDAPDEAVRVKWIARFRKLDAEWARDQRNAVLMRSQIASAR